MVEGLTTNILPTNETTLPTFICSASRNHENNIHEMTKYCSTTKFCPQKITRYTVIVTQRSEPIIARPAILTKNLPTGIGLDHKNAFFYPFIHIVLLTLSMPYNRTSGATIPTQVLSIFNFPANYNCLKFYITAGMAVYIVRHTFTYSMQYIIIASISPGRTDVT